LLQLRDEHDPDGLVVAQRVEEVFARYAPILELVVRGRTGMTELKKKKLKGLRDRDSAAAIKEVALVDCDLQDCAAIYTPPDRRGTFKGISLTGCRTAACVAYGAVFDTVVIDTLDTKRSTPADLGVGLQERDVTRRDRSPDD
jgi:hypothetical protein